MAWLDGVRRLSHDELVTWTRANGLPQPFRAGAAGRVIAWLTSGALEAVATDVQWTEGTANKSTGAVVLLPKWWAMVDSGHQVHYSNLWKTGEIALYVTDPSNGVITRAIFKGVRFNPDALAAALDGETPMPAQAGQPAISEDEFETWVTPSTALTLLHHLRDDARRAILYRVEYDGMRTVAEKAIYQRGREEKIFRLRLLETSFWKDCSAKASGSPFWRTGDVAIEREGGFQQPSTFIWCVNVRFDPDGIARLLPQRVPDLGELKRKAGPVDAPPYRAKPRLSKPDLPAKVSIAELREWYRANESSLAPMTFPATELAAELAFAGRRVTRQPLRDVIAEFGHTKSRGNSTNR